MSQTLGFDDEYDPNAEVEEKGRVSKFEDQWIFTEIKAGTEFSKPEIIFQKFEYTDDLVAMDSANGADSEKYENIELVIDKKLNGLPILWRKYNNLKIKKLKPDQRDELNEKVMEFVKSLKEDWKKEDIYKGYRELHNNYSEQQDEAGSVEKLIEKVVKEGQLPRINSFVDVYNFVSVVTGVSIGAHDIEKILGTAQLKVLSEDIEFEEIGTGEKNTARKGEYAYVDDRGVLCRLDTKQSKRTRIGEKTSEVLVILQGHEYLNEKQLEECFDQLEELLKEFGVQK